MSDEMQLAVLLAATGFACSLFIVFSVVIRLVRRYGPWSADFATASASTNLARKLRGLGPGIEILMPSGCGFYPLALSDRRRRKWESKIEQWLKLGVAFTLIISKPYDEATEYWKRLVDRFPPNFRVFLLDRDSASPDDAIEIEKLDTFHPVLVVKDKKEPFGMWVENRHDFKSDVAYNVSYFASRDIVDYQRARF